MSSAYITIMYLLLILCFENRNYDSERIPMSWYLLTLIAVVIMIYGLCVVYAFLRGFSNYVLFKGRMTLGVEAQLSVMAFPIGAWYLFRWCCRPLVRWFTHYYRSNFRALDLLRKEH